jgi:hypothetical protein
MSEEDIDETYYRLGIELNKSKIGMNGGKRAVAKMCSNSLWGTFGQRQNLSKTEYVTPVNRFY